MELTVAVFTAPTKAFAELKERPRFWFPLLVVGLATAAIFFWYYSVVDFDWLVDRMMSGNPRTAQMTDQQRDQAMKVMTPNILMWSSVVTVVLYLVIARALEATYFSLAGNVANVRYSFKHWFALSNWTALPHLIGIAAMAAYMLTAGTNQIGNEELSLLSLNELLFHKTMADKGFTLLSSLTVIHPWSWWLTALGIKQWSGRSWVFSAVFALAPIALLYGGWAAWAFK